MKDEINLPLRQKVLEIALQIEDAVSKLILAYLNIEKEETKTLGNKSSSLSFKSKIDLLHDLDVIKKQEYDELLLLMEFRNKFLHSLECNSFMNAISMLSGGQGKQLAKYSNTNSDDEEYFYLNAYGNLFIKCLDTVLFAYDVKQRKTADRKQIILDLAEYSRFLIDGLWDIYEDAYKEFLPEDALQSNKATEIISKAHVLQYIGDKIISLTHSDEFKELHKQIGLSFNEENVMRFLK